MKEYLGYVHYIKQTIHNEGFDRLIIFGPHIACLLNTFLIGWKGKYIIDYRDLSIEQKPVFKQVFSFLLKRSYINVISSPGFKKCLPQGEYYISHNFDVEAVEAALDNNKGGFYVQNGIDVLTIGGIRDYSSNIEIVNSLANCEGVTCRFVGKGLAEHQIKEYCENNHISNVLFWGFYRKEEEAGYIKTATFLNIFYPRVVTHDTAMSNRFYNSLIFKRPMIVTKDTTQGEYVEKYGLGVAIKDGANLKNKLEDYLRTNYLEYCNRCDALLKSFLNDQTLFESKVKEFIYE